MKVYQISLTNFDEATKISIDFEPHLILAFISPQFENPEKPIAYIREKFPEAIISGCSTSGEIHDVEVRDATIALTAIGFDKTKCKYSSVNIKNFADSKDAGQELFKNLSSDELRHILVFSDGLNVNGAALVEGLAFDAKSKVTITGGLAGDGSDFNKTFVVDNDKLKDHTISAIGLYGSALKIGYGSKGGWDSFGIERKVTSSKENVLFELDDVPALSLYKSFLGSKASELPGSGLLFPLSMRSDQDELPVVRTILAVDEDEQSLTFAGNIPEGSYVRLMKANVDRLIIGAEDSAQITQNILQEEAQLAILISCVGRRLVMKQMVEEEVEAVKGVLGNQTAITGFYSYGELAPFGEFMACQLHNQTMTITTFSE